MAAINMAVPVPKKYINTMVIPWRLNIPIICCLGINVLIIKVYTGRRAEQLMRGRIRMVTRRSFQLSMVRVAMIPGIAQAYPLIRGSTDFPWSPILLMIRSIIKATRAI
jgi:hypothetical protein